MMPRSTGSRAAVLLFIAMIVASGCGSATPSGATSQSESHLNRVLSSKILRVATIADQAPWESIAANGQPQGFDIDIANLIAADLGATAKFTIVDVPGRITSVQTDQTDISIAGFSITPQRAEVIDFTQPYVVGTYVFTVLSSRTDLKTASDVKTVAVEHGSTGDTWIPKLFPNIKLTDLTAEADSVQAMTTGQVDAVAEGYQFSVKLVADNPSKYTILPGTYTADPEGIGIQKGDQTWLNWLNTWLYQFIRSGDDATLYQKYFGIPMGAAQPFAYPAP